MLCADLRRMGIRSGDVLIVHASMKRIGWVRGGPQAVVRELQRTLTRSGTLLMPAFSYSLERIYEPAEPFDPGASPAQTGFLSETFRRSHDVVRSLHPTHSVCAWGRGARDLVGEHESRSGLGAETPFHRAAQRGARVLMIGCDFTSLSLVHVAEALADAPYLPIFCWFHKGWKPTALVRQNNGPAAVVDCGHAPGCSQRFDRLQRLAEREGLVRRVRFGEASSLLFSAAKLLDRAVVALRRRPQLLLCEAGACRACDERRSFLEAQSNPESAALVRDVTDIIERTGVRLAGSPEEHRAAEMIAERMTAAGLQRVKLEEFPIVGWTPGPSRARFRQGRAWVEVPSAPCAHSPSTPPEGVAGKTVNIESMADVQKIPDPDQRIGVLWDGYGASGGEFRRLMERGFRGFMYVDRRFIHGDLAAIGVAAQWIRHFGTPMVSIPYPDAVRLFGHGPVACRLQVEGRNARAVSTNVIGEIPGETSEAILIAAHHDSTFNTPAPDDNLSGVALLLHLARVLTRDGKPRRTIRFCSFGAEEMLSEGARYHALLSGQAAGVKLVINNDGVGARVGTTQVHVTGPDALARWVARRTRQATGQFKLAPGVFEFGDQFPFNVAHVPSLWFYRVTMPDARHFHHTVRDSLAEISFAGLAALAAFEAELVRTPAFSRDLPFRAEMPAAMRRRIKRLAQAWLH
jgi:aminoglycoside 3-N-acetyltransferase